MGREEDIREEIRVAEKWIPYWEMRIQHWEALASERELKDNERRRLLKARQRLRERLARVDTLQDMLTRPPLSARGRVRSRANRQRRGGMKRNWSYEEEGILIDAIATAIRAGGTVSDGLVDAAARIGRTPSACGFRFYREIEKDDPRLDDVKEAKRERLWSKIHAFPGGKG